MKAFVLVVSGLVAACSSTTPTDFSKVPLAASIVAGDAQTDSIGATLATPVSVAVVTADGAQPATGVVVNFVVTTDGCGKAFAGSSATDGQGRAADRWVLGTKAGSCTMEVRSVDSDGTPHVLASATAKIAAGQPANWPNVIWNDSALVAGYHAVGPLGLTDRLNNRIDWVITSISGPFKAHSYAVAQGFPDDVYVLPTDLPGVGSIAGTTTGGFAVSAGLWSCRDKTGQVQVYMAPTKRAAYC